MTLRSSKKLWRNCNCLTHLSVAYISASAELLAVIPCLLADQWRGPPNHMRYPESDHVLKSSSSVIDVGSALLWSWGPQLASVRAVMRLAGIGNFRKLCRWSLSQLEKDMPKVLDPLRYLRTWFACARCPSEGLDEYLASMLVIGAISGLVDVASQLRDPTIDWNFCVRYCCLARE